MQKGKNETNKNVNKSRVLSLITMVQWQKNNFGKKKNNNKTTCKNLLNS